MKPSGQTLFCQIDNVISCEDLKIAKLDEEIWSLLWWKETCQKPVLFEWTKCNNCMKNEAIAHAFHTHIHTDWVRHLTTATKKSQNLSRLLGIFSTDNSNLY